MNPNIICENSHESSFQGNKDQYDFKCNLNKVCLINQMIETTESLKKSFESDNDLNDNNNNKKKIEFSKNARVGLEIKKEFQKINFSIDSKKRKNTFINFFEIYCNTIKIGLIGSSASIGNLVANIISPFFTDQFGRIKTIKIILVLDILIKLSIFYIKDFTNLLIALTIINITNNLIYFAASLYINEMVSSSHRGVYSCYFNSFFGISGISFTLIFYFTYDWIFLNLFSALCSIVSLALIHLFLYESLRFYKVKGLNMEILDTLQAIAQFNKRENEFLIWRQKFCIEYKLSELAYLNTEDDQDEEDEQPDIINKRELLSKNRNTNQEQKDEINKNEGKIKSVFCESFAVDKNLNKKCYERMLIDGNLSFMNSEDKDNLLNNKTYNYEIESFIYGIDLFDKNRNETEMSNDENKNLKKKNNKSYPMKYGTFDYEDNKSTIDLKKYNLNLNENKNNYFNEKNNFYNNVSNISSQPLAKISINKIKKLNKYSTAYQLYNLNQKPNINLSKNYNTNTKSSTIKPMNFSFTPYNDIMDLRVCNTVYYDSENNLVEDFSNKKEQLELTHVKNLSLKFNKKNAFHNATQQQNSALMQISAVFSNWKQIKTFLIFSYISFVTISGIMYNAIDMKESPDSIYYPLVLYFSEFLIISLVGYLIDLPSFGRKIPCIFFSFLAGFFYISKFYMDVNLNNFNGSMISYNGIQGEEHNFNNNNKNFHLDIDGRNRSINNNYNGDLLSTLHRKETNNFINLNASGIYFVNSEDVNNLKNYEKHIIKEDFAINNKNFNKNSEFKINFHQSENPYLKRLEKLNNYKDFTSKFYQSTPISFNHFEFLFLNEKNAEEIYFPSNMSKQHLTILNKIISDFINEAKNQKNSENQFNEENNNNNIKNNDNNKNNYEFSFIALLINYFVRFSVSISFNILIEYNFEVYSTDIRSIAFNINKLFSRFGDFFTPLLMAKYYNFTTLILGVFYLAMAFLIQFLRETRGESLKDDVNEKEEDYEKFNKNKIKVDEKFN